MQGPGTRSEGCDTVGNLNWNVDEDAMRYLFQDCDEIINIVSLLNLRVLVTCNSQMARALVLLSHLLALICLDVF